MFFKFRDLLNIKLEYLNSNYIFEIKFTGRHPLIILNNKQKNICNIIQNDIYEFLIEQLLNFKRKYQITYSLVDV